MQGQIYPKKTCSDVYMTNGIDLSHIKRNFILIYNYILKYITLSLILEFSGITISGDPYYPWACKCHYMNWVWMSQEVLELSQKYLI